MLDYYSFNPLKPLSNRLHEFDKLHYFYWFYQCLVGASIFDETFKGDRPFFFPNLKCFKKNEITACLKFDIRMGILDYLLACIPFITQAAYIIFNEIQDYAGNTDLDNNRTVLKGLLIVLLGIVMGVSLTVYLGGWIVTMPLKMLLAPAIMLLSTPFLLWHYSYIQQQKLDAMQMLVLDVSQCDIQHKVKDIDELITMPDTTFSTFLLDESSSEISLQSALADRATVYPRLIRVRPLYTTQAPASFFALGLFIKNTLLALILPNQMTKKGILAILNRGLFDFPNKIFNRDYLIPLLRGPHWKNWQLSRSANAFFAVTARMKGCADEKGILAAGDNPDKLFAIVSQFAGLPPPSQKINDANAAIFSKYPGVFFRDSTFVDNNLRLGLGARSTGELSQASTLGQGT